jgi:2-polyprenyl-3-methyl-5-hydroxy-6-metoxy-1,4-benzoquinol methylase
MTLLEARALNPKSVLEVAAGDGDLCACLAAKDCRVAANDLRQDQLRNAVCIFRNAEDIQLLPGNLFDLDPAQHCTVAWID